MDQPGKVASPARGQLNRENNIPLSPCVPENLVSRDGFSRPVPRQPAHLHTLAESGAYLRDSSRFPRRRPFMKPPYAIGSVPSLSGHAMRTDGVHCRESAGTGPVNLKVVPNGCCLGRSHGPINTRLSFPHPQQQYNVGEKPTVILYTYISHHAQPPIITQHNHCKNSMFARLGTDYEIRNQWFFAILESMTTD